MPEVIFVKNSFFQNEIEKSNRILYTPAQFAKSNLIYLQETGELKAHRNHKSQKSSVKSYLFFIVMEGSGKITHKNQDYIAVKGDCVFLDCENEYILETTDESWTLKWVHFYGNSMNEIYRKFIYLGGKPCFKSENFAEYDRLLDDIYIIASSDSRTRDMKIYEKLVSLLCSIMDDSVSEKNINEKNSGFKNLDPIKKYIDMHYNEKITLDMLAENFFINKFYLTRLFKKQYGMSVVNYITYIRITHAKQLLKFTDLSVEYVGEECGFNDSNYFARTFKKVEGVTPAQFRKMW